LHNFVSPAAYRNCGEIYKSGERKDGVYTIKPDNLCAFDVFCDQTTAGGRWTVFQKRLDGSVDFFLNWSDYKVGFGDLNGEFWLGLDKIYRLTSDNNSMLRVDLEDFEGNTAYAEYNMFGVMSENDKYKLNLGSYSGMRVFLFILHCKDCTSSAILTVECQRKKCLSWYKTYQHFTYFFGKVEHKSDFNFNL
jgi:hypothetical protein